VKDSMDSYWDKWICYWLHVAEEKIPSKTGKRKGHSEWMSSDSVLK